MTPKLLESWKIANPSESYEYDQQGKVTRESKKQRQPCNKIVDNKPDNSEFNKINSFGGSTPASKKSAERPSTRAAAARQDFKMVTPEDEFDDETIIAMALDYSPWERFVKNQKVFDPQGRLNKDWHRLRPTIQERRDQRDHQRATAKKKSSSVSGHPQSLSSGDIHGQEPNAKVGETRILPPKYQSRTELSQHVCRQCGARNGEFNFTGDELQPICSLCLRGDEPDPSLTTGEPRRLAMTIDPERETRISRSFRGSSAKYSSQLQRHSAGPQRGARPLQSDELDDEFQASSRTATAEEEDIAIDTIRVQGSKSRHPPKQVGVAAAEIRREQAPSPSPENLKSLADLLLMGDYAKNDTKACNTCQKENCSCTLAQRDPHGIMCSDATCGRKWFSGFYLEEHCGIHLSDAYNARQTQDSWFCPECTHRARTIRYSWGSQESAPSDIEFLEDDEVRKPLEHLSGLILQYISTIRKRRPQRGAPAPFLEIPCIRDEGFTPSVEFYHPLVHVLRRIFDVQPGVLLKDKVIGLQLQNQDISLWIRAVLTSLFLEFVFQSGSPFEDAVILRENMIRAGCSPEMTDMIIQRSRVQTMNEKPKEYSERVKDRYLKHVRQLNAAMWPLVSCNSEMNTFHMKIAEIAGDLNAKISAYNGIFEGICPKLEDRFDQTIHTSDSQEHEAQDFTGQDILVTTMIGVKFRLPGRNWRICSRAKVRTMPHSVLKTAPPKVAKSNKIQSYSRIVPPKRPYHDLAKC